MKLQYLSTILVAILVMSAAGVYVFYQNTNDIITQDEINQDDEQTIPLGNLSFQDAVNAFSFDIFKELYSSDVNQFISAYSIFTALAMTYEGAKTETAEQMAEVLQVQQDNESFHLYMKNLYDSLNADNNEYNISTANALWVKQNFELLEPYLAVIQDFYGGNATPVDYSDPVQAAAIINEWVETQTNGLITDLIKEEMISPLTALILTNAIYFKGVWETQFDPLNTTLRPFTTPEETTVDADTMAIVDTYDYFWYTENEQMQLLELPYTGNDISMMVVLPKTNDLDSFINLIDAELFSSWLDEMYATKIDIYLPKFEVETEYHLNQPLINLGMEMPFTEQADFSGITGSNDLFISDVVHKAFINVSEQGTEAAAATAVIMELNAVSEPDRPTFDCNHPFLYMIYHKQTDTILFMGTITDPTS